MFTLAFIWQDLLACFIIFLQIVSIHELCWAFFFFNYMYVHTLFINTAVFLFAVVICLHKTQAYENVFKKD